MLALFLFVATSTVAQYKSIIAEPDSIMGNYGRTIIRGGNYNDAWTYQNNSNSNNLIHLEQFFFSHAYAKIPNNFVIHDMKNHISSMYFCGEDTALHKGVVGLIKTTTISIDYLDSTRFCYFYIDSTTVLKKLVMIEHAPDDLTMVAIGENSNTTVGPNNEPLNVLVECDFSGSISPLSYVLRPAYNLIVGYERLDDICLTDDYIVAIGYGDNSEDKEIILHLWDLTNPPYHQLIEHIFYYPEQLSINDSRFYLSAMLKKNVAVSYAKYDNDENYHKMVLRTVDLTNMNNIISQMVKIDKFMMHGMTYIPYDKSIVVLCDYPLASHYSNIISNYVYFDPLKTNSYGSVILYDPTKYYNSITSYNQHFFISSGDLHWIERDKNAPLPAYNSMLPRPIFCPEHEEVNVEIIENLRWNYIKTNIITIEKQAIFNMIFIPVKIMKINIDCYSN